MTLEHRRLTRALLLSLLIHALLLSLTFGGEGFGLPSFGFPWRERRIEATDLRLVIVPAQVAAAEPAGTSVKEPSLQASIEHAVAGAPVPTPSVSPAPTLNRRAEAIVPKAKPTARAKPTAEARPEPGAATGTSPADAPLHTEGSGDAPPAPIPEQAVLAVERSDEAALVVPAAPAGPTPVIAAEPSTASPESVMPAPRDAGDAAQERIDAAAQERADELAKLERSEREAQQQAMQLEAARIETARQEAEARQEAARLEAGRQDAERVENARLEAERQEARRQAAALQEAARQDAPRQEAQRVEDARLEAERQEAARQAARQEAERQEAARQATDLQEAARDVVPRIDGRTRKGRTRKGRTRTGRSCARGGRETGSDASGDRTTAGRGGRPA